MWWTRNKNRTKQLKNVFPEEPPNFLYSDQDILPPAEHRRAKLRKQTFSWKYKNVWSQFRFWTLEERGTLVIHTSGTVLSSQRWGQSLSCSQKILDCFSWQKAVTPDWSTAPVLSSILYSNKGTKQMFCNFYRWPDVEKVRSWSSLVFGALLSIENPWICWCCQKTSHQNCICCFRLLSQ